MSEIGSDVLRVLSNIQYDGNVVRIVEKLDRKLYERTNQVLESIGGKWNRGKKGHVFASDPRESIERAIDSSQFTAINENDFFETPPDIVRRLLDNADIRAGHKVLEPSAGRGAIADAIRRAHPAADLSVIELRDDHARYLDLHGFNVIARDFLKCTFDTQWDRIVMNPPFSKQEDVDHVRHAFSCLRPGGRLVAVMSNGVSFRTNRKTVQFREEVQAANGTIVPLPAGAFKASGTMVNTVLCVMEKRRNR